MIQDDYDDEKHHSYAIDHNTTASLPGQIRCSVLRYSMHYPAGILVLSGVLLVSQISALYFFSLASSKYGMSPSIVMGIAVVFFMVHFYWNHVRASCYHGDLCAGRIVSIHPLRAAFFTDLRTGRHPFPVVKIVKLPIKKTWEGKNLQVGDRLAAVALYQPSRAEFQRWADFDPKPVQCYTADAIQVKTALDRIPQQLWDELENGIQHIGDKTQTIGLYHLPK